MTARNFREWDDSEINILERCAGVLPLTAIHKRVKFLNYRQRKTPRTLTSVKKKIYSLGLTLDTTNECFSCRQIALMLGCQHSKISRWLKNEKIKNILQPYQEGDTIFISRENLKKFFVEYRNELSGMNVDIEWLLSLFIE